MMNPDTRQEIESEYGMPVERLLYHFYREEDMSSYEIAEELDQRRTTVDYWLKQSGIELRRRELSDVQRILIMAYLDAGMGDGSIARHARCAKPTVRRYRESVEESEEPIGLNGWISGDELTHLQSVVDNYLEKRTE